MELGEIVKELRKRKGLSQEALATNSGLSLRTVQRVEKQETTPTGETLRRICETLGTTPEELTNKHNLYEEQPNCTIKTQYEYLHIFKDKLLITRTPKINNLVEDYRTFTNYFFRTLAVFFVFIPIFIIVAIFMYYKNLKGVAFFSGAMALIYLVMAFYGMLFSSGTSYIKMKDVRKIEVLKRGFYNTIAIYLEENKRIKIRGLMFGKKQLDTIINTLLSEKLIDEKDIKNENYINYGIIGLAITTYIIAVLFNINSHLINTITMTFLCTYIIGKTIYKLIKLK